MDCSVVPLPDEPDRVVVSTHDFFYPLVEDPFLQGRIACCNVLSDLYSFGVTRCDTLLMTLAASRDMPEHSRHIVTRQMIAGFSFTARQARTRVTGGQTVLNPWPIIGGTAVSCLRKDQVVMPISAKEGAVLVVTKPLGTQLAVNAHQWMHQKDRWAKCEELVKKLHEANAPEESQRRGWNVLTESSLEATVKRAFAKACDQMATLNLEAAELMWKHNAQCATDVTGFGIVGHAEALAATQSDSQLVFRITHIPALRGMACLGHLYPVFKWEQGRSAETSGGLMVALPSQQAAQAYVADLKGKAWIVGHVERASHQQSVSTALLDPNYTVIEV